MRITYWNVLLCFFYLSSCVNPQKKQYTDLLQDWMNREIQIPDNPVFTVLARDTVDFSDASGLQDIDLRGFRGLPQL